MDREKIKNKITLLYLEINREDLIKGYKDIQNIIKYMNDNYNDQQKQYANQLLKKLLQKGLSYESIFNQW